MQTNILDHGARPDGVTLNTLAFAAAIDTVAREGGGTVIVPPGIWLTGMIRMKDRVHLHLEAGAVIKASGKVEDHPKRDIPYGMEWNGGWASKGRFHLLIAEGCKDIAITGQGTFDGNGPSFYPAPKSQGLCWPLGYEDVRRMCTTLEITGCKNVRIQDITITNVSFWTLHLHESDQVRVSGIRIINAYNAPNGDGIDITGCRSVAISDCFIDTCDDAICVKTFPGGRSSEDIAVTNCLIRTHCVALKMGCIESFSDMRNIVFSNCVVRGSHRAVGVYSLHGATIEDVLVDNVVCDTCIPLMFTRPIHIDLRQRQPQYPLGAIRGIRIRGLSALTTGRILLTAQPGAFLEDLSLSDIDLRYVALDDPAIHGRTVGGSQFSNASPDARAERAAIVAHNVKNLDIRNLRLRWPSGPLPKTWDFPEKLANGTHEIFHPADWTAKPGTSFHAVVAKNVQGGRLDTVGLSGYNGGETVKLEDCNWRQDL